MVITMHVSLVAILCFLLAAVVLHGGSGKDRLVEATEHPHPYGRLCDNAKARIDEADNCVTSVLMFGNEAFKPPLDEASMDAHCERTGKSIECVRSFVKECMEPFPKQLLGFGVKGFAKVRKQNCEDTEQRADFLKAMPCLNNHITIGHKLMKVGIMSIEHVRDNMPAKAQLPGVCCTHFFFRNTLKSRMTRECTTDFGEASANESGEFFDSTLGEATEALMEFMCGKYSNLEACDANLPELMSKIRGLMDAVDNNEDIHPESHSILFPILDVFTAASKAK